MAEAMGRRGRVPAGVVALLGLACWAAWTPEAAWAQALSPAPSTTADQPGLAARAHRPCPG